MIYLQVSEDIEELWHSLEVPIEALEEAANATIDKVKPAGDADVTIVLGSDELLGDMNRDYLEIDDPTDVLAFSADFTDPDTEANYLGDVIVSVPRAVAQAREAGHSVKDELQLLVVHGTLHLLGYDHLEEEEKRLMQEVQDAILKQLGSSPGPIL